MGDTSCEQLDDYLAGWLTEGESAEFEAHLSECRICQIRGNQQQRIDRLLVQGVEKFDSIPSSLLDRIESRIQSYQRRRTIRLAWSLSTAAAIVLLIGAWSVTQRVGVRPKSTPIAKIDAKPEVIEDDADPTTSVPSRFVSVVKVAATDPSAAILVPARTTANNVSIVWVYPTNRPATLGVDPETN